MRQMTEESIQNPKTEQKFKVSNPFLKKPYTVLLWTDVPISEKVYKFKIDVHSFKEANIGPNDGYITYDAEALEDYPEFKISQFTTFLLHLPQRGFQIAYDRCKQIEYKEPKGRKRFNAIIWISRDSKIKITIHYLKVDENTEIDLDKPEDSNTDVFS